jgi:hypothetical protein
MKWIDVSECFHILNHQLIALDSCAGPCEPSRRLVTRGPPRSGVTGLTTRTPASLKGKLTRRIFTYLVSFWLTNAIDRIVKEQPQAQTRNQTS